MSRIIITGGGSNIPGLKPRLLDELSAIVKQRGWDPVQGKAADERRRRLKYVRANPQVPLRTDEEVPKDPLTMLSAAVAPQVTDPFEEKLRRERNKDSKGTVSGVIRGVVTLGAWTGGSLIANLRIKGVVEIEKDSFLQHGLAGARREAEASNVQQKVVRGERAGWTLGAWA
jgi:actin-related protein